MPPLQSILDAIKLAPRYLTAIGLFCGILLLCPENIANTLGIIDFTKNNRQWLGLAFIAALTLLVVCGGVKIGDTVRNRTLTTKSNERTLKRLHSLTEEEKQILRFYIFKQSKTNVLRIDDGVVSGLVSNGIIYVAANQGNLVEGFAHNITDLAWEYLHEHIELLEGITDSYVTHKRERRW